MSRITASPEQADIRVSADGYVRWRCGERAGLELILPFPEVVKAMSEEKQEWWRGE